MKKEMSFLHAKGGAPARVKEPKPRPVPNEYYAAWWQKSDKISSSTRGGIIIPMDRRRNLKGYRHGGNAIQ
jgi:hypothetical protein